MAGRAHGDGACGRPPLPAAWPLRGGAPGEQPWLLQRGGVRGGKEGGMEGATQRGIGWVHALCVFAPALDRVGSAPLPPLTQGMDAEFIVLLDGIDESTSTALQARLGDPRVRWRCRRRGAAARLPHTRTRQPPAPFSSHIAQARHSYFPSDIRWQQAFEPVITRGSTGALAVVRARGRSRRRGRQPHAAGAPLLPPSSHPPYHLLPPSRHATRITPTLTSHAWPLASSAASPVARRRRWAARALPPPHSAPTSPPPCPPPSDPQLTHDDNKHSTDRTALVTPTVACPHALHVLCSPSPHRDKLVCRERAQGGIR